MLHPVGSLPPTVYWKRRALGILVLVVLIVVLALLLNPGNQSAASGRPATTQPVSAGSQTPQLELIPAQPLQTTTAAPSIPGTSTTSGAGTSGSSGTPTPTTMTAATTTAATTTAPPAATPAAPVACTDEMLALTAASQAPEYATTDKPTLLLSVQNIGTGACFRDLGGAQQEFLLFSGETRLWGSNDCYPSEGTDMRTLQPGETAQLSVVWSGQSSRPGCAGDRSQLAPGAYTLRARLGTAVSPDATLTLR